MTEAFRPTLLVGVGGTGCSIAEAVYANANRAGLCRNGRIVVLGFDTDENDMRRLHAVERRQQIRFSSPDTIYRIVEDMRDDIAGWFVDKDQLPAEVRSMTLLDGAMQIRMLTRLALHAALKRTGMRAQIEDAVARLGLHDNRDVQSGALNIMMVGSLAGATGSGSFIQIALLLRQICRERGMSAGLRGLFLLPDVFVRAGSLPSDQISNVLANGFASLKELFAVTAKVTNRGIPRDFAYEYAPDLGLRQDGLPFDSLTLIDFENTKGGNLGRNLDFYKAMTARATYLQLFSPIGARVASVTINDARAKMAAAAGGTTELFSGVGVSAVIYPMDQIAEYLVYNLAQEILSDDWLRLDRLYFQRVRRYNEQRAAGNVAARLPDQGTVFLEDLRQLAVRERVPFFREIYDKAHPIFEDEKGERIERPLHLAFLDALLKQVLTTFKDSPDTRDLFTRPFRDSSYFQRETLVEQVRTSERQLDNDLRRLDDALRERPLDILQNLLANADGAGEAEWRPYHLQSYLVRGGPHMVQVRYFLYALHQEIEARRSALDPPEAQKKLFLLARTLDPEHGKSDPPSSRASSRMLQLAETAAKPSLLGRLFKGTKSFGEVYPDYYNSSLLWARSYGEQKVKLMVLEALAEEVDGLIKDVTSLFLELGDLQDRLAKDVERLENHHEAGAGAFNGNLFVYADAACKRNLWEELREQAQTLRQDESANRTLVLTVYNRYRENRKRRRPVKDDGLGKVFFSAIVKGFARRAVDEEFRPLYDFSVLRAIKREAELKNHDWLPHLRHVIDVVGSQSEPFLVLTAPDVGQRVMFWAVHPSIREELADEDEFNRLFTFNQGESPLVLPEFSHQELLCMNTRVNLDLRDLKKLHPGAFGVENVNAPARGAYYAAYQAMIDDLLEAELRNPDQPRAKHFTPHVDCRWHRPGMLPEIFRELDEQIQRDLHGAFLVGLGLGLLRAEDHYGRRRTLFDGAGKLAGGGIARELVASDDDWEVYNALADHPELVRGTLAYFQQVLPLRLDPAGQPATAFDDIAVVRSLALPTGGILTRVLAIGSTRQDEQRRDASVRALIQAHARLVHDLVDRHRSDLAAIGRHDLTESLLQAQADVAFAQLEETGVRVETLRTLRTLHQQGLAAFRSEWVDVALA